MWVGVLGLVVVLGFDVSGLVVVVGLLVVESGTSVLSEAPLLSVVELGVSLLCSVELVSVTSVWFWVVELPVSLSIVVSLPPQADIDKTSNIQEVYISKFGIFSTDVKLAVKPNAPITQKKGIENIKKEIKRSIPRIKDFFMFSIGKTCRFSLLILIDLIMVIL